MRKRNFFTLIELLVVVSIIGILAAMLMGAYGRVTATANKVICASNLKQLSVGYTFYAQKSDGEYPPFAWIMDPNGKPGDNDDMFFGGHPPQGGGGGLAAKLDGGNWVDSSMVPIMLCPSDEEPETRVFITGVNPDVTLGDFGSVTTYNQTKQVGNGLIEAESSYGYNLNLGLYEVLQMSIPDPVTMLVNYDSEYLLGVEFKENGSTKIDINNQKEILDNGLALRHLGQANLLFADGHVGQGVSDDITRENLWSDSWRTTGTSYMDAVEDTNGGGNGGNGGGNGNN